MCMSFTLEVIQWPVLGQLIVPQGTQKCRLSPMMTSALQGCLPRVLGSMAGGPVPLEYMKSLQEVCSHGLFYGNFVPDPPPPHVHIPKEHLPVVVILLLCSLFPSSQSSFSYSTKGRLTSHPFWFWPAELPPRWENILVPKKGRFKILRVRRTSFN